MSRDIRFRAWDVVNKTMITHNNTCRDISKFWNFIDKERHFEVMQFTGLKDKNGKEIYEGDIVEDNINIHTIVFNMGGFTVANLEGNFPASNQFLRTFFSELTVIGNIYENKNLLDSNSY